LKGITPKAVTYRSKILQNKQAIGLITSAEVLNTKALLANPEADLLLQRTELPACLCGFADSVREMLRRN
jgi:hypothetical protein